MQNSELFRRGIVVPLDGDAEDSLRTNNVDESTNVRFLRINDQQIFDALWNAGLFREINSQCESLLDDYEEAMLEAPSAAGILAAIESVADIETVQHPSIATFLADFRTLIELALASQRPMLFVL